MNKPTTNKARGFIARNPTFIGRVLDVDFYESPIYGDEVPLVAITSDGELRHTHNWELPSHDEIALI